MAALMTLRRYRIPALLMLALHLNACTTWQPLMVSPRQFIVEEQPSLVRVTQASGTQMVLRDPSIENDSIVGTVRVPASCPPLPTSQRPCAATRDRTERTSLDDVSALEMRQFSRPRTIAAFVLVPVGLFALFIVLICATTGESAGLGGPC